MYAGQIEHDARTARVRPNQLVRFRPRTDGRIFVQFAA